MPGQAEEHHTGNTLAPPKTQGTVPSIDYPNPNIHEALKPKKRVMRTKLPWGFRAARGGSSFQYHVDSELHQTVISGQGELHLQVAMERIKERFNTRWSCPPRRFPSAKPSGATARRSTDTKSRAAAPAVRRGLDAREPAPRDHGVEFTQSLVGPKSGSRVRPSVEKGVNSACTDGIIAGYRVVE
ncbi:MAG: hypothetical protein CM1200mP29_07100 [Verrucomicrobiota bacterium]|nr:MAG: hypothetical protein CM1200mP29_07100 [Verrucomicrobiota bacterium]